MIKNVFSSIRHIKRYKENKTIRNLWHNMKQTSITSTVGRGRVFEDISRGEIVLCSTSIEENKKKTQQVVIGHSYGF